MVKSDKGALERQSKLGLFEKSLAYVMTVDNSLL
jgi:hypothetical protein